MTAVARQSRGPVMIGPDEEHFDDLEYEDEEDEDEDPWDLHDYSGESPESLRNWYNGRVL